MIKKTMSRRVFEIFNYAFFTLFCVSIIVPFLNCIAISMSSMNPIMNKEVTIFPVEFTLRGYKQIAGNMLFWRAFFNTVWVTVTNTVLTISIALMAAYALSNKYLKGKKVCMAYYLIPYYFAGGLIPTYLTITNFGLGDNYLVYVLPAITSIYYIIVFRNIIAGLPQELIESAEIDGAKQPIILFKIVIPLIVPTIAAFVVFSAVDHWNSWMPSMLYMRDEKMWTLQYRLRGILNAANMRNDSQEMSLEDQQNPVAAENLQMAALMLTVLPIIIVYPFVQKYFIKGVLVGAVKG